MKSYSIIPKIPFFFVLFLYLLAGGLAAQHVQLAWSSCVDPDISYYGIYRSTHIDSSFRMIGKVDHPDTTYFDETVSHNTHYYYTATSVDIYGNESDFSNIVEINMPAVPVELSGFTIQLCHNKAILEWSTATESNNYGFEIQRSRANANQFSKIGFLRGSGTTSTPNSYRYVDHELTRGKTYYRLKQIDYNGDYTFSDIIELSVGFPHEFRLYQNHPNPFNPSTVIPYSLQRSSHVELAIFNINGQEVYKLVDEIQAAGEYSVNWNTRDYSGNKAPSGTYYYRLKCENEVKFRRMVLLR